MREIIFRAWNTKTKEMTDNMVILNQRGGDDVPWILVNTLKGGFYKGHEVVWLQYTGIKDAYGKEVYEGDIINYVDGNGISAGTGIVDFENGYVLKSKHAVDPLDLLEQSQMEVVGNIYENPELVK